MNENQQKAVIEKGIRNSGTGSVDTVIIQKNGVIRARTLKRTKQGKVK